MRMAADQKTPDWYDESKLRKAYYAAGYTGWVIDLGDGTGRYANEPLLGADPGEQEDGTVLTQEQCDEINRKAPHWGDRVRLEKKDGLLSADSSEILERYIPPSP
jgi:hypothetical protein